MVCLSYPFLVYLKVWKCGVRKISEYGHCDEIRGSACRNSISSRNFLLEILADLSKIPCQNISSRNFVLKVLAWWQFFGSDFFAQNSHKNIWQIFYTYPMGILLCAYKKLFFFSTLFQNLFSFVSHRKAHFFRGAFLLYVSRYNRY